MVRVPINETVVAWAIERSGKPFEVLQRKFPRIRQWEQGKDQPTLHQLEELAKSTFTPLGYFFLPAPPDERLPIPHFRTASDERVARPSPRRRQKMRAFWLRSTVS
jgi:hypothetical protein